MPRKGLKVGGISTSLGKDDKKAYNMSFPAEKFGLREFGEFVKLYCTYEIRQEERILYVGVTAIGRWINKLMAKRAGYEFVEN